MNQDKEATHFIEKAGEEQREILKLLRNLIAQAVPEAKEQFKWNRPVYGTQKDFSYLQTAKNYVTLGFFNFKKVDDPKRLLEGTGKQMRHIKISKKEDIKAELFSTMLHQAAKQSGN
ncbi:DUF1801 domain-containing protein [Fulvivirga sp. M361]|uniref:DUF1801 domain-containing protein n=1 Tax=Fulvivirga sp. M361 TaxID=2594266 RepID=UPI00117AABAA|nr:DUF1801 domain-containing protein [Fulvivirga sp. M361]TRX48708.1 DUF1801 domain-containing protein [Fulvivirga sp. M361]